MTQNTATDDAAETQMSDEADRLARRKRAFAAVKRRVRNGTAATLVGAGLLAGAAGAARRTRRRAGMLALGGATLLGVALRQRRSGDGTTAAEGGETNARESAGADDGTTTVSAEAYAHRMGSDMVDETAEANPRGIDGEPDVDTETDAGEGRIRFSTGQDDDPGKKPHIDEVDPKDPRYPDDGEPGSDGPVDVSLSKTKMTDELGKVAGPDDDQAFPAREGTDPEPTSKRAPERDDEPEDDEE